MIKYHQEHTTSGTGLAYQISSYVMMRSLAEKTGLEWVIDPNSFKALRNTFVDLNLNIVAEDIADYQTLTFDDELGFAGIEALLEDGKKLHGYPTVQNFVAPGDNGDLFLKVKQELKFRQDIVDKCKEFRDQFDGEVIAMHVRRGDFSNITSGMFLCGADYYENALAQLPDGIPVLIFTNDKDSVIGDSELIANNPERFTFITDLFNGNEFINCDVGQELDRLIDISGECKFDAKTALAKMANDNLPPGSLTQEALFIEMARIAQDELHPTYKEKLKTHSYNYSYDLCLMTMCDYVIMANSTFSMWGAELGNPKKVIYPMYWMQGHPEDIDTISIKTDLGGYNQTKDLATQLIERDNYIAVENPDPRSFTILK
jgi:hypothetical protein